MRTAPMCFAVLRVPRCRVYSLVNTWWGGFDSLSWTCKEEHNFRLLGSSVCGHGGNSRRWSRRTITTTVKERSKKVLSSAANISHGIGDEIVTSVSTKLTINKKDDNKLQQIQCTDIQQLIAENKDLATLTTFIVFDLETTGFKRDGDRIIEIACQDLKGGENSTFHTLINPERNVLNADVHNITTDMVKRPGVPRMQELLPILLEFVKSREKPGGFVVLVAHNVRSFDGPFLRHAFDRCNIEIPPHWRFLDTVPLARNVMKSKAGTKYSLGALREHYGIKLEGKAHRAMFDVQCLAEVLQRISFDEKLTIPNLLEKSFPASELTISSTKKK